MNVLNQEDKCRVTSHVMLSLAIREITGILKLVSTQNCPFVCPHENGEAERSGRRRRKRFRGPGASREICRALHRIRTYQTACASYSRRIGSLTMRATAFTERNLSTKSAPTGG